MAIGRNNIHMHLGFEYFIDKTMLLGDSSTPHPRSVCGKRFRMPCACARMDFKLYDESCCLAERGWFRTLQCLEILLGLRRKNNVVHQPTRLRNSSRDSSECILTPSPRRICSRPASTRRKNSSFVSSVGSAASSRATRRRYLATRWSAPSFSATMPRLRNISAFKAPNCTVDICYYPFVSGRKSRHKYPIHKKIT